METKLNIILMEFASRLLNVQAGKENPTLGELIETPKQEIVELIEEQLGVK